MQTYQGQASEWTSELGAQEAAYKILQDRQTNGIKLTKEQTDFMNQYSDAVQIGKAAVDDSTVSAGIAAQNMLLNKQTMDDFKNSTGDMTSAIRDLIDALYGIPPDVKTEIDLQDQASESLSSIVGLLNAIDGRHATFYVDVGGTGVSVGNPDGPHILPYAASNGLTMNAYAAGGTVMGGGMSLVGERGPEMVWLPNGAQVTNTEATKSRMKSRRGNQGGNNFFGPVTLYPSGGDAYTAISSAALGGAR
jgi:hypothetical protein